MTSPLTQTRRKKLLIHTLWILIVLSLTAKETIHTWDSLVESHRFESLLGSLGLGDALKEIYGEIKELTSTVENV